MNLSKANKSIPVDQNPAEYNKQFLLPKVFIKNGDIIDTITNGIESEARVMPTNV